MRKLITILFVLLSSYVDAQYFTTSARNREKVSGDGVIYYLPRNVMRLDFEIERVQYFKGPFSDFSVKYFDENNYVKEDGVKYFIKNVNVTIDSEPDSNAAFYLSQDEKSKEQGELNIAFSEKGTISSFGVQKNDVSVKASHSDGVEFPEIAFSDGNFIKICSYTFEATENEEDSIASHSLENVLGEKLTLEEKASKAAMQIVKIRNSYYDLISGFQEVDYGTTIEYMAERLLALEKEYMSLFVGKAVSSTIKKSIYVVPEEGQENSTLIVAKFSEKEGLMDANAKAGEAIKIQFQGLTNIAGMNKPSNDELKSTVYNNKFFYRIPGNVVVKLMKANELLFEERTMISQFGAITTLPMNKMKLVFDENTGMLMSAYK